MITREFQKGDAASSATYSDCETYRYSLTRVWDDAGRKVAFIMLNPSKATEAQNDPTIERCERRARALGFGGFRAVNIFALRETDPKLLRTHPEPQGPDNDDAVSQACLWADVILAGWGAHGEHLGQGDAMREVLRGTGRTIHCLGLTKAGHPRHPLYIAYAQQPEIWTLPETTR
ncbi:DUF1643 domain-containing protein [Shimia sp. CNT1-13L.2]|uniref:DUF1643 domain-containing protein n=1 Tax=Shimia sp. CNT1-13L.2 TaxID=2959663 RepID=UPI0020CDA828|nr:DUF1643 domain-containing protein [Shimia sp. CNT1-13L.2]MCP9480868.1 DUF1643 domain-containing protein [Shimia sp. CNT1-13L.2]